MDAAAIRRMISQRDFRHWRGLPPEDPAGLLPAPLGPTWGEGPLGNAFEPAARQVLEIGGYDEVLVHVRGGTLVLCDGRNPDLAAAGWPALSAALGPPDAARTWTQDGLDFPAGEQVFAGRGISVWLNPDNGFVAYVSLFAPTTLEAYDRGLRPHRPEAKRR